MGKPYALPLFQFINLVQSVNETPNEPSFGEGVIGDGGNAIGPLQIWRSNFTDACEHLANMTGLIPVPHCGDMCPTDSWHYHMCKKWTFSRIIMILYYLRHCPKQLLTQDYEHLARVWNGGPDGYKKEATIKYWNKLKPELDRAEQQFLGTISPHIGAV